MNLHLLSFHPFFYPTNWCRLFDRFIAADNQGKVLFNCETWICVSGQAKCFEMFAFLPCKFSTARKNKYVALRYDFFLLFGTLYIWTELVVLAVMSTFYWQEQTYINCRMYLILCAWKNFQLAEEITFNWPEKRGPRNVFNQKGAYVVLT